MIRSLARIVALSIVFGLAGGVVLAEAGPAIEARAFEVRHRSLSDAADLVGTVLSPEGTLTLRPRLRTLVVQDRSAVLDRVASLLAGFDVPPRNVEVTLALFLGTDRRDEGAGRQSPPASPSREVRGVTETLGDVTKWSAYELIGSRSVVGTEGSAVSAVLSEDYRVRFDLDAVVEPQSTVKFKSFVLQRRVRGPEGDRWDDLVTTSISIPSGRMLVVGAAKAPDSRKALFMTLQARAR